MYNQVLINQKNLPDGMVFRIINIAKKLVLMCVLLCWAAPCLLAGTVKSVRLVLPPDPGSVIKNISHVFTRQVQDRCEARIVSQGEKLFTVELAFDANLPPEAFSIQDLQCGGVRIAGSDERGVLYGVGKFLRMSRYDRGGFTPGTWRGNSVPQKKVRGIYFATHFHNFYHDAPIEEVQRYVEDLGLWGFNVIAFWFDMRYGGYGIDDPEAKELLSRLRIIGEAAKGIGLDVAILVIGNESYQNSPLTLRAETKGLRGAIYPWNICPNESGGMDYILKVLGNEFDWASSLDPQYVIIWPYDPGGCGCDECKPWGSNGFLKVGESVAGLARKKLPNANIVFSTWLFDEVEWKEIEEKFDKQTPWFDIILAEEKWIEGYDMPGNVPAIGFPEISMHETFPWGGFGATPLTERAEEQWDTVKKKSMGGFPYSEGIYEDITKAIYSQLYWNDRPAEETIREYVAFEYSPDVVEEIVEVINILEQNHHFRWWPGKLEGVKLDLDWFPSYGVKPQSDPGAEDAYETVQRVDKKLTPEARSSWRWRLLYLRALLDAELKANGGKPNEKCKEAFAELIRIYHARNANPAVRPPLPKKVE